MDLDNPWIALRKARIRALHDDPRIACSIHGSCKSKGTKHGFGQSMDLAKPWIRVGRYYILLLDQWSYCRVHGAATMYTHAHGKEIINVVQ